MTTAEILSIAASVVSLIGGPLSLYFSWKAANKATRAVEGSDELARRLTSQRLYDSSNRVIKQ